MSVWRIRVSPDSLGFHSRVMWSHPTVFVKGWFIRHLPSRSQLHQTEIYELPDSFLCDWVSGWIRRFFSFLFLRVCLLLLLAFLSMHVKWNALFVGPSSRLVQRRARCLHLPQASSVTYLSELFIYLWHIFIWSRNGRWVQVMEGKEPKDPLYSIY